MEDLKAEVASIRKEGAQKVSKAKERAAEAEVSSRCLETVSLILVQQTEVLKLRKEAAITGLQEKLHQAEAAVKEAGNRLVR